MQHLGLRIDLARDELLSDQSLKLLTDLNTSGFICGKNKTS